MAFSRDTQHSETMTEYFRACHIYANINRHLSTSGKAQGVASTIVKCNDKRVNSRILHIRTLHGFTLRNQRFSNN